jgi:preprotein translocase subunit SecG
VIIYFLYSVHVLICLFLILVVLLQQGKGADLSVFGGGATQAAFGPRGGASLLHKLTVGAFVAFILTTMAIGLMSTHHEGTSVMKGVATNESAPATPDAASSQPATSDQSAEGAATQPAATPTEGGDGAAQPADGGN